MVEIIKPKAKKEYLKPEDVSNKEKKRILDFLNTAKSAKEIADTVEFPEERDVGIKVSQNILDKRVELGSFTDLKQVADVPQIGPERFTEIVMALREKNVPGGKTMGKEDIKRISGVIKKKKLRWKADVTSVSKLSAEEKKIMLGLKIDPAELKATADAIKAETKLQAAIKAAIPTLPSAIDWRNKGGDWTTSIKDQGACGSCVAFGTLAAIEARINIACKNPNLDKDLSEAHLFYCGCGNCCGTGWYFDQALDFCKKTGVGLESSFPYTAGNQPCKSGVTPYIKITDWKKVLTMNDRKNILANKGPMIGGMAVYTDFFAYSSGVYEYAEGVLEGYHAICVVGYDNNQKCWICKNSWGPDWGEGGWFKIGYGQCGIDTEFAFYDVDLTCPQCESYRNRASSYLAAYIKTGYRKYQCYYYYYTARYFYCMYQMTRKMTYYCYYLYYLSKYYYCIYQAYGVGYKRYLCYSFYYMAKYYYCLYKQKGYNAYLEKYREYYDKYRGCI